MNARDLAATVDALSRLRDNMAVPEEDVAVIESALSALEQQAVRAVEERDRRFAELAVQEGLREWAEEALRQIAETARWYANNGQRLAQEVDHALCVEVLSMAESAVDDNKRWTQGLCPFCGHEWRRHDPDDGKCDSHSEESMGVCRCGRDLAWMQERIASLSTAALAAAGADTEPDDD